MPSSTSMVIVVRGHSEGREPSEADFPVSESPRAF